MLHHRHSETVNVTPMSFQIGVGFCHMIFSRSRFQLMNEMFSNVHLKKSQQM